jgi:hypothetical protein
MRRLTTLLVLAMTGVLLSGCATDPGAGDGATGDPATSTDRTSTPIVDRSEIVTPTTPTPKATRLTGRVAEGVEAGCVVLRTEAGAVYTLVGDLSSLADGAEVVTLEGRLDPELLSHCQQGPVFVVTAVVSG